MDITARTRSAVTLAVLAVLFVTGVAWAWSTVTDPFPEKMDQPACTDSTFAAGDRITPGNVLVNVFNASGTDGLAGETMDALVRKGFAEGAISNTAAETGESGVVIWTPDPDGPAARLLRTYFGKNTRIADQATADPGVTVVVGEGFPGIKDGKTGIKVKDESTVCSPPSS
ncbi:LytR C-terminal domain-containing protein [Nocardioides bizhenqiangii]|uniref:LytR C-terminal domain-containing protein n=1 Tax=Nocardioides bizhenqiangii TaxID=3095076 RepID=A0ABZ0ZQT4_9ACTN|nr:MULTISPECIES: LytR C-terminal domain-containing protein [unclassified Nocardioides]MDZ5619769.1 LytR C-terminal domain-containing protein [Nocardioides sp. HM23]WQQ26224.1 LytR C-terminal domain-containing protein [Nocardioides sp. HM61]